MVYKIWGVPLEETTILGVWHAWGMGTQNMGSVINQIIPLQRPRSFPALLTVFSDLKKRLFIFEFWPPFWVLAAILIFRRHFEFWWAFWILAAILNFRRHFEFWWPVWIFVAILNFIRHFWFWRPFCVLAAILYFGGHFEFPKFSNSLRLFCMEFW